MDKEIREIHERNREKIKKMNYDLSKLGCNQKSKEELMEDLKRCAKGQIRPIGGFSLKRLVPLRKRRKKFKNKIGENKK